MPDINERIYSLRAIRLATFIFGPLAGGYLCAENFKVFEESRKAETALITGGTALVIVLGISLLTYHLNNFPQYLLPILYSGIAGVLAQKYQGEQIIQHLQAGGSTYGFWNVFGVAFIAFLITIGVGMIIILPALYFMGEIKF